MSGRKESPRKVSLAMIKGKPITTSVPAIRYHASDDELEELYPSTDDEKRFTPDPGDLLPKSPAKSPSRTVDEKVQDEDSIESNPAIESHLVDGATPPSSDPWKVFSEIKGKITKTFEEKLSEMKSDKRNKKKKKRRSPSRNSSISDSEELGDATPSDENAERQRITEPGVTILRKRGTNPARYVGFSKVKTGLKDSTVQEDDLDCVESGVEAAEYQEDVYQPALDRKSSLPGSKETLDILENRGHHRHQSFALVNAGTRSRKPELLLSRLLYRLFCRLAVQTGIFFWVTFCLYCLTPVPSCLLGFGAGVFVTLVAWSGVSKVKDILARPPEDNFSNDGGGGGGGGGRSVPVLEIPAVEEHAVVERFEGWLNELPYTYDPEDYHVARTRSVFFRLEGHVLRVMETMAKVPKRTVWDEPRHKLKFTRRRVYDLLGARVELLPEGLIRRRRWSKKYPICVTLRKEALISNIALKYATDGQRGSFDEKRRRPGRKRKAPRKRRVRKDPDRSRQTENPEKSARAKERRKPEEDEVGDDEGDDTDDDLDGEEEEEEEEEDLDEPDLDVDLDPFSYEDDLLDDTEEEEQLGSRRRKEEEEEEEDEADEEEVDEDLVEVEKVEANGEQGAKEEEEREQSSEKETEIRLFIFARADRQKEDWYRRLVNATSETGTSIKKQASSVAIASDEASHASNVEAKPPGNSATSCSENMPELSYNAYMAKYLDTRWTSSSSETSTGNPDEVLWVNCLIARVLFDMHKCPETITLIQDKIQRKLSNIKLPYFMECLLVSEVIIGQGAPVIRKVSKPITDERGLWLDLDISYKGCLTMTVETKLNLMKLTRTGSVSSNTSQLFSKDEPKTPVRSPIFDSDVEDTPETSTEDEDSKLGDYPTSSKEPASAQSSGKKFLSMVDRIAANKYFQHATELSYVRRAMEGVSNTEIRLMVTISGIEGSLSVNIPPAPADRLWYGFRPVPRVTLTVKPALGERTLNIVYVTKWIEAKLLKEFEKLVVLPNMDDLVLPLCPNYPYLRQ